MASQPSYAPPPPPAPPKSGLPGWVRWVGLGCGALVLFGVLVGAGVFLVVRKATSGPEEVVKAFLTAAGSGDYATAHDYFSAPLKEEQSLETFSAAAAANSHLFQVTDTTFNHRSVDMSGAELSGTVKLASGTVMPAAFKLVRENEEWRLISYSIGN